MTSLVHASNTGFLGWRVVLSYSRTYYRGRDTVDVFLLHCRLRCTAQRAPLARKRGNWAIKEDSSAPNRVPAEFSFVRLR